MQFRKDEAKAESRFQNLGIATKEHKEPKERQMCKNLHISLRSLRSLRLIPAFAIASRDSKREPRLSWVRILSRASDFGYRICVACLSFLPILLFAQPKSELGPTPPLDPAEGERQARALVANLLAQKPEQGATNTGVARIRGRDDKQREVPMRFEIFPTPTNWFNVYEAAATGTGPGEKLTIVHADGQANQYCLSRSTKPGVANGRKLADSELMVPFAGSDFWVVDLGLEFLHWPQQRVLKKQMRRSLFCDVLQSVNPQPAACGYARVLSWIAINRPDDIVVVHAEAYDGSGKLLKEFDPKRIQKINGVWQLEEMEIRNRQTGSRTRIEFNLGRD